MFIPKDAAWQLALLFSAFGLMIGAVIGLVAAGIAYRSRFTGGIALRAAALGGFTFVFATILSGWAAAHSPASWLRMQIAKDGLAIALVSTCLMALLAGVKRQAKEKRPT
jgi:hypothetical protein